MWICTNCGTENNSNFCRNCGRERPIPKFDAGVTINYKAENLPVYSKNENIKNKATKKNKKKAVLIVFGAIFAAFIIFVSGLFTVYFAAKSDLKKGKFDEAKSKFEKIQFLFDSGELVSECIYQKAHGFIEAKEYKTAAEELEEIAGYKDSEELIISCYLNMLEKYKADGDFAAASQFISSMDKKRVNSEIKEYEKWCDYAYAKSLIEKDPKKARELLEECGSDYEDVDELLLECSYLLAKKYHDNGEIDLAYSEFEKCIDYKDSEYLQSSLASEINRKAIDEYNKGNYEESVRLFELCKKTPDDISQEVSAYKLFLSYRTEKYQRPAVNSRLYSYLGSYTAARKIVLENEDIFADFIAGRWSGDDGASYEFSGEFTVMGDGLTGKCKFENGALYIENGGDSEELFKSVEIINEDKIKVVLAAGNLSCTLSR